jgi:hypothetical protein
LGRIANIFITYTLISINMNIFATIKDRNYTLFGILPLKKNRIIISIYFHFVSIVR